LFIVATDQNFTIEPKNYIFGW